METSAVAVSVITYPPLALVMALAVIYEARVDPLSLNTSLHQQEISSHTDQPFLQRNQLTTKASIKDPTLCKGKMKTNHHQISHPSGKYNMQT